MITFAQLVPPLTICITVHRTQNNSTSQKRLKTQRSNAIKTVSIHLNEGMTAYHHYYIMQVRVTIVGFFKELHSDIFSRFAYKDVGIQEIVSRGNNGLPRNA